MGGAIAGPVFTGGLMLSTTGAFLESDRKERAYYRSMAAQAEENARRVEDAAKRNTQYIFEDAGSQQRQLNRDYIHLSGKQRTSLAYSGVGAGSATAQMILRNSRLNAQLDQDMLAENMNRSIKETNLEASLEAQNYRDKAREYDRAGSSRLKWWSRINNMMDRLI